MFQISKSLENEAQEIIESLAGGEVEKKYIKGNSFFITTIEDQPKNVAFIHAILFNGKKYFICVQVHI